MAKLRLMAVGLSLALIPTSGSIARSQTQSPPSGAAAAHSSQNAKATSSENADLTTKRVDLDQGAKIAANLESTVDASTAKPGDQVVARVTKNIKAHGQTVVRKGDQLVGRVTQVQAAGSGNAGSSVGIAFNRVVQGDSTSQLNAVLSSVVSTPGERRAEQQQLAEPLSGPLVTGGGSASGGGRSSAGGGGGLLGGAASTAGSAAGAVGSAAGGVAGAAGSTATSATGNVAGAATGAASASGRSVLGSAAGAALATPRNAIHLGAEGQGQATQQSNLTSVLGTRKGNLRLEQGTELQFRAAGSAESK